MLLWLPGKIENPQAGGWTWQKRARLAKSIRERVAQHVLVAVPGRRVPWAASAPKEITLTAMVGNAYDDDNLRAALKPYRDGLTSAGIINDDRESAGHSFRYAQVVSRGKDAKRGVEITVALLPAGRAAGDGGEG